MGTPDFFRARLDTKIELLHPLAVVATRRRYHAASIRVGIFHTDSAVSIIGASD